MKERQEQPAPGHHLEFQDTFTKEQLQKNVEANPNLKKFIETGEVKFLRDLGLIQEQQRKFFDNLFKK